jgi:hypothetical protein
MSTVKDLLAALEKLTLQKAILGIFAGIAGISMWTIWEQRNAVFITLTGSIFAMSSMAAGVGLLFVAGVCWLFVAALDRKTDLTQKAMGDQIAYLQQQITQQRTDMERMREDFQRELEREQRDCAARLADMREAFTSMLERARP